MVVVVTSHGLPKKQRGLHEPLEVVRHSPAFYSRGGGGRCLALMAQLPVQEVELFLESVARIG